MANSSKDAQVRYFATTTDKGIKTEKTNKARTTQSKRIKYFGLKEFPGLDKAPLIPHDCTVFKFEATFEDQKAGHYCISWKLKLQPWFSVPWGFHVQAIVTYKGDPDDRTGSLDVLIPKERIEKLRLNRWQEINIQEQLIIHPHCGNPATVKLVLKNNEPPEKAGKVKKAIKAEKSSKKDGSEEKYGSFLVSNVSIHPFHKCNRNPQDFDCAESFIETITSCADNIPISRISAAPNVNLIATLCVENNMIHVSTWDYSKTQTHPRDSKHSFFDGTPKAVKDIPCEDGISKLPLGISLSPDGKQLAVFQEPKIGDWEAGAAVKEANFKFRLISFDNPDSVIPMDGQMSQPDISIPGSNIPLLQSFMGFAKFLPSTDREQPKNSGKNNDTNNCQSLFAACNGIYLDIFDCSRTKWRHLHSITLTDLSFTLSRRITCQMMVESMGPTIFLWLEGKDTCSTWSVNNGANVSRLSSWEDNVNFADHVHRSNLKIAISPDESIIALSGTDGTIRTFFAKSGIEINSIRFNNSKIEYLGFISQNGYERILVIVQNELTRKSKVRVCDPLDLNIRTKFHIVPIPTAGTTLLLSASCGRLESDNKPMVCAAEGAVLRFYNIQKKYPDPIENRKYPIVERKKKIEVDVESNNKDVTGADSGYRRTVIYELNVFPDTKPLGGVGKRDYWILHVSIFRKTKNSEFDNKELFNFVPEPWLRIPTSRYAPEDLLTIYFLPCNMRFVVIGFQSIQIWALPSRKYSNVTLLAFWSKPKDFQSLLRCSLSHHELSKEFHAISDAFVFHTDTPDTPDWDSTRLKVILLDESEERVILPGRSHSHHGVLPCYHSIHLLAAAYSIASENEAFKLHADALVQFAARHINRVTPFKHVMPKERRIEKSSGSIASDADGTDADGDKGLDMAGPEIEDSEKVGILRLLLNNPSFQRMGNPFLKALLSTGSWIPREEPSTSPIGQAMYVKNKSYVTNNAIVAKPPYQVWKSSDTPWHKYTNPVFRLRTQLPFQASRPKTRVGLLSRSVQPKRIKSFPASPEESKNSDTSSNGPNNSSASGGYTFGMVRWAARFLLVLAFSLLFIAVTVAQIRANAGIGKYLSGWDTIIYTVIGLGGVCLLYEFWKFCLDWRRYVSYPYNYLSLLSFCSSTVGCILSLIAYHGPHNVQGPDQIWWISFAILGVYINILFELKVFQPIGVFVYTLIRISIKIVWFLAIFGLSLVAFTHAFLHILHTRNDSCAILTGDDQTTCEVAQTKYPQNSFQALLTTYFFIAGIYDPLDNDLEPADPDYSLKILLAIFIAFTVILMMNLLIAIMNDGFSESKEEGQLTWLRQWSQVIVEVELFMMSQSQRENRDFFPDYIYYGAIPQDVEEYERKGSAKRPSDGPTDDKVLTDFAKDDSQQRNLLTVRQDVKYLLRNQLRIENLMGKTHPTAETNSRNSIQDATPGVTSGVVGDDKGHPKTFYLYYDDDTYGAVLKEKETDAKYLMELLYSTETKSYYVYYHNGRIDFRLNGPYGTIEDAKRIFQDSYKEKFGVEWIGRKEAKYECWTYDEETYNTIEEAEDVKAAIGETEIKTEIGAVVISSGITKSFKYAVRVFTPHEAHADVSTDTEDSAKKDAAPRAKSGVDGLCPIFKIFRVCYEGEEEYSAALTEKKSGKTCVIQLLRSDEIEAYYVYYRYGETDSHFSGSYKDIDTAKVVFKDVFKKKFDIEWSKRKTAYSEHWKYVYKVHDFEPAVITTSH
ncbi:hypothetical protein BGZ80_006707 [Entomortierella chlamydospora]|uniref:Ion transport domain-containing protein n=1 Tax=Entomortierella chlamydospora TaxID=101097 RepID=A0A9P6N019_9FUNG|nr:hypothetical protein BGZ80_006707 [Entomortierella chlamydospora]